MPATDESLAWLISRLLINDNTIKIFITNINVLAAKNCHNVNLMFIYSVINSDSMIRAALITDSNMLYGLILKWANCYFFKRYKKNIKIIISLLLSKV